jgi:hypothetical protein
MPDQTIPKLKFKLGGKDIIYDLESEVQINPDHLNQSLLDQPTKFAIIATASAAYQGSVEGAKAQLDLESAKLDSLIREEAALKGEKTTEDKIKARISAHPKYIAKQQVYMEQSQISRHLQACVEAFRQRMQMLITLANNQRAELDMNLYQKRLEYDKVVQGKSASSKKH